MRSRLLLGLALWTLALGSAACGSRSGDGDDDGGSTGTDGSTGGVVEPPITTVSGSFFLGDLDRPALGYEIWIIDHVQGRVERLALDAGGTFSFPIAFFAQGGTYSLHLVRDYQLVGDVDLSPVLDGVQAAFVYEGGYGFDLGQVILTLTAHGTVDQAATSLVGRVGGGFSLERDVDASLATYPLPDTVSTFELGSQLNVFDPSTALYGVYRRLAHPAVYARLLAEHSRIQVKADVEKATLLSVYLLESSSWTTTARIGTSDFDPSKPLPLWSDTDLALPEDGDERYLASVTTGGPLPLNTVLLFNTQPVAGTSAVIPRILSRLLSLPPQVVAASGTGGAPVTVDYASTTAANGLTRAFCQSGNVTLTLVPPLDQDGVPLSGDELDAVAVAVDHYAQVDGKSVFQSAKPDEFLDGYQEAFEEDPSGGMTRSWDPGTRTLTFALDEPTAAAPTQSVTVPFEVLLNDVDATAVFSIRLRVYYRSSTGATEGGIAVWLRKDCL